jgi:uncharacterized OB-fold protein
MSSTEVVRKPRFDLPTIELETKAFWDGARAGMLLLGRCGACNLTHYYPRPFCPKCWSEDVTLKAANGRATLYTYSVVYLNDMPPFDERLPYVAAMVELEEGVRVSTNIVDCEFSQLRVGMPLTVVFREITDGVSIPVFCPA